MDSIFTVEHLSEKIKICVSKEHRFGTDAFLLAAFSKARHKDKAVDFGAGCGIIPLLLYKMYGAGSIYGVELQEQGYRQFVQSVELSGLEDRVHPIWSDLKELKGKLPFDSFDLVTCNPPYQKAEHGFISPISAKATARHELGCTIDDVCKAASELLKTGGRLCICQRPERLADVICAMRNNRIEPKRLRFVAKTDKTAPWLFLIEGKKGAAPGMVAEATLQISGENGFSEELQAIYRLSDKEE